MKAFIIFNILKNFYFHLGWDLCLSNKFYKQISRPKCMKLTKFMSWEGNRERSHTLLVKSRYKNFRLIPSRKIPGSRDFAKSRPGNPGIENSWSRWGLPVTYSMPFQPFGTTRVLKVRFWPFFCHFQTILAFFGRSWAKIRDTPTQTHSQLCQNLSQDVL